MIETIYKTKTTPKGNFYWLFVTPSENQIGLSRFAYGHTDALRPEMDGELVIELTTKEFNKLLYRVRADKDHFELHDYSLVRKFKEAII